LTLSPSSTSRAGSPPAQAQVPALKARQAGQPIAVAVVGTGFIADFHLEILAKTPGVRVVGACDADLTKAQSAARRFGLPHAVASIEELPALGVQVAHVLVPPAAHVALTRKLLELGIGALVEKPLAISSREARELHDLAEARGLVLGVNHNALFHPAFQNLMRRLGSGEIGRVEHVRICLSVPLRQLDAGDFSHWMFRSPRNIIFEQAPHPFAQLYALIGRVRNATTTVLRSRELQPGQVFHERWLIAAVGERGTAEIYLAFGEPFTRSTLEVLGSDGSLEADLFHNHDSGETKTLWLDFWNSYLAGARRGAQIKRSARRVLADYLKLTLGLGERQDAFFVGMRDSVREFYAALLAERGAPINGEEGARVLDWCEAVSAGMAGDAEKAAELPVAGPVRSGEVVVLGGTGFIGKRVVEGLLERHMPVTVIVRRAHSLPVKILEAAREGRVRLVRGSLEDADALRRAVEGSSCVIQIATGNGSTWEVVERAMVGGSVAIAQACIDHKVKRFIYVSSIAALYLGADAGAPMFDDSLPCDPKPEARSLYARGKIAAEAALTQLQRERGLPLVILRPGVVLGDGTAIQHSGLGLWARDNHCVGWGIGDTPLPLVLVDDVADALVRMAAYPKDDLHGKTLNLAANTGLSAQEVVQELRRLSGRDLHFHPRALWFSQALEIGKWLVKIVGRRPGVTFPSYRDLKSRALVPGLACDLARERLGWKPEERREAFLDAAVRVHAPKR
jgi:predicted dehydrogenase/nucleoside-diphosphate-sugar epimerase